MKNIIVGIFKLFKIILNNIYRNIHYRKNGISGHLRVRNEAITLNYCVESVINFVDELIITYNDCNDGSEEIINDLVKKYNKKIKAYKWTKKPLRIWEYSNFGMKKCKYKWYMKIDADHIYFLDKNHRKIILNSKNKSIFSIGGINTFDNNGKYSFIYEDGHSGVEWFDDNNKKWNLSNISEKSFIFVRGLTKYKRNDKSSYCEYVDLPSWKNLIFLDNVYVHYTYMKRKAGGGLTKINFENLTRDDINKLNLYDYLNLISRIQDIKYINIPIAFNEKNRSDYWYEQKEKEWNNKIF